MATTTTTTTTQPQPQPQHAAIAPLSPAGSTPKPPVGGHAALHKALMGQGGIPLAAHLLLTTTACPWRQHTPGAAVHGLMVALQQANPTGFTMQALAENAQAKLGMGVRGFSGLQGHVCWLYTWGTQLLVNGAPFAAFAANPAALAQAAVPTPAQATATAVSVASHAAYKAVVQAGPTQQASMRPTAATVRKANKAAAAAAAKVQAKPAK